MYKVPTITTRTFTVEGTRVLVNRVYKDYITLKARSSPLPSGTSGSSYSDISLVLSTGLGMTWAQRYTPGAGVIHDGTTTTAPPATIVTFETPKTRLPRLK